MFKKKNNKNQIILGSFAAAFSVVALAGLIADKHIATVEAAQNENTLVAGEVLNVQIDEVLGEDELAGAAVTETVDIVAATEASIEASSEEVIEEVLPYTVTVYESPLIMYAGATINVRSGAGTDYTKL